MESIGKQNLPRFPYLKSWWFQKLAYEEKNSSLLQNFKAFEEKNTRSMPKSSPKTPDQTQGFDRGHDQRTTE